MLFDYWSLHECVKHCKLDDENKIIQSDHFMDFIPPEGEFILMNYHISKGLKYPFLLFINIEELSSSKLDINIKVLFIKNQ